MSTATLQTGGFIQGAQPNHASQSLAEDRPTIEVTLSGDGGEPRVVSVDLRDLPAEFFHEGGKIPASFSGAERAKQIRRISRGGAAYLGGPTIREMIAELEAVKAKRDEAAAQERKRYREEERKRAAAKSAPKADGKDKDKDKA